MKKFILMFCALTMVAMTAKAADAFIDSIGSLSFYTDSYVSFDYQGPGTESTRNLREWQDFTFSMYTHDGAGNILETFTADSKDAGTFAKLLQGGTDSVGFIVSNGNESIYSTPGSDGKYYITTQWEDDVLYIGFFVKGFGGKPLEQADIVYAVEVIPAPPPTGQPLPGTLATLLIAGGALRARRRRK